MSQHGPEAQEALTASLQVLATQHGLLQNSAGPQSHCSPASTTPSPQLVIGNIRSGTFLRHSYFMELSFFSITCLLQELHAVWGKYL